MNAARKQWILRSLLKQQDCFTIGVLTFLMVNNDVKSLDSFMKKKFPQETWETLELKIAVATGDAYEKGNS